MVLGKKSEQKKGSKKQKEERKYQVGEPVWYDYYYMTKQEIILYSLLGALGVAMIGWIFYHSLLITVLAMPLGLLFPRYMNGVLVARRKRQLMLQFKDMLYSLSSAVSSGSSIENVIDVTLRDMKQQYGEDDVDIVQELELMASKLAVNQNIEDVFADFGQRSGIEDVQNFANIFEISKRTGGNLVDIIRQTSNIISEKIDVKLEMDTMLSGKKMEQKVLTVIPIVMVFVLTEATGGFMDVIFTTWEGRVTATIVLAIIAVGFFWSKKITDLEI